VDDKIDLRMIRDWLKDGGGTPTVAEKLLEELLNNEIDLGDVKADILHNERLHTGERNG